MGRCVYEKKKPCSYRFTVGSKVKPDFLAGTPAGCSSAMRDAYSITSRLASTAAGSSKALASNS